VKRGHERDRAALLDASWLIQWLAMPMLHALAGTDRYVDSHGWCGGHPVPRQASTHRLIDAAKIHAFRLIPSILDKTMPTD
jgi:hypothetical protein